MMLLVSRSGSSAELHITGYEFPGAQPIGVEDWDVNWLIVAGRVHACQNLRWGFQNPSLTTWEVSELIAWMRQVGGGIDPAKSVKQKTDVERVGRSDAQDEDLDHWARPADAGWFTLLEPNLSFAVARIVAERVHLRVGVGAESGPPPVNLADPDWYEVTLDVARDELLAAALERELTAFPAR